METQEYYNAKPSKVSNIGKDIAGARRMHFDTYETAEEKQVREARKVADKNIATIKEKLRTEILSEDPSVELILSLQSRVFELTYKFNPNSTDARSIITEKRAEAINSDLRPTFNKMVNSYNKLKSDAQKLAYNPKYYLKKMAAKYAPKQSFTEQSGISYNWNQFKATESTPTVSNFLAQNVSAVQFGNSVTDSERAYICSELSDFITRWRTDTRLNAINLMPVSWSFGARGKARSVAYYQASIKVISVNRNNIGSLIHELGHFIDDMCGDISRKISYETVSKYRESIKKGLDSRSLNYYCKRAEIFARAFEAYCFLINADFGNFAQMGKAFLPELNEELIGLIKEALKV